MGVAHHLITIGGINVTTSYWVENVFEKDKKKMAEKYLWKSSIFSNVVGCNNCSKVSMHGKANSSKMLADIFRNMHFFCDAIELEKSVEGTLKV